MAEEGNKEIAIVSEETIKDKIYFIRGQKVMVDSDLAEIYGYSTRAFNQQVKNNIDKFDDDFRFQILPEELPEALKSKFLTLNKSGNKRGQHYKKMPYVFSESGIYMLMTVLKGDLAIRQSKALIRLFKQMKDYLIDSPGLVGQGELVKLTVQNSVQIAEMDRDIKNVKASMATKDDLSEFMKNFMDNHIGKEFLFMDGKTVESDVAYTGIYSMAKKTIFIIDNYISVKTLLFLRDIKKGVKVTVFSDNLGKRMTKAEYDDYQKEYPGKTITFQKTCDKFHDRFIVLDYGTKTQKIYHCGGSSKDGGTRTMAISRMENNELFEPMIQELLKNPVLNLR